MINRLKFMVSLVVFAMIALTSSGCRVKPNIDLSVYRENGIVAVKNLEGDDIVGLKLTVNDKYDYVTTEKVPPNQTFTVAASEFADDVGNRFNPYSMKIKKVRVVIRVGVKKEYYEDTIHYAD